MQFEDTHAIPKSRKIPVFYFQKYRYRYFSPIPVYRYFPVYRRGLLLRQLEESVRIKSAKASGVVMLGRGPKAKRLLVNRVLLNRKLENYSPWLLTLDGG